MNKIYINKYTIIFIIVNLLLLIYYYCFLLSYIDDFQVVIARYNEDISWVEEEFPNEKIIIYNKGKDDLSIKDNWEIIDLPNLGRESHTYLHYIINHYHNLPERILFLQGNPYTHSIFKPLIKYKNYNISKCNNIIAKCNNKFILSKNSKELDDWINANWGHTNWGHTNWAQEHPNYYDIRNFIKMFITKKEIDKIKYVAGAQFAIDRDTILSHKKDYYEKIFDLLHKVNPAEGHYIERLWDIIFTKEKKEDEF